MEMHYHLHAPVVVTLVPTEWVVSRVPYQAWTCCCRSKYLPPPGIKSELSSRPAFSQVTVVAAGQCGVPAVLSKSEIRLHPFSVSEQHSSSLVSQL